jgi:hypothetical protein
LPNYLNIVIKSEQGLTGIELNAEVGIEFVCKKPVE